MRNKRRSASRGGRGIAAMSVSFAAGIAFAWAAFGFKAVGGFGDDVGSRADWVAAIGTWAIGVAAAYYAREAHQQRIDEYREARRLDRQAKQNMLDATILRMNRAELLPEMYSGFLNTGICNVDAQDLKTIHTTLRGVVPVLFWPPDEIRLLAAEAQRLIIHIENSLIAIQQMLQLAEEAMSTGAIEEYIAQHETIRDSCMDIRIYCNKALLHVVAERNGL